jgi:hypothetical protein
LLANLAGTYVEMEVLRILVCTQISDDSTRAMLLLDLRRHRAHDVEYTMHQINAMSTQICEGWNVNLGNDDDVDSPMRSSVMKRKHVISLHDDLDRCSAAQSFIAIEIVRHMSLL